MTIIIIIIVIIFIQVKGMYRVQDEYKTSFICIGSEMNFHFIRYKFMKRVVKYIPIHFRFFLSHVQLTKTWGN